MALVRDLINDTLKLIGALASGEVARDDEVLDGLKRLNDMLGSWNNQKLTVHQIIDSRYDLVAGQQDYTLGVGGDFSQTRPVYIERAILVQPASGGASEIELPLEIQSVKDWATEIPVKDIPTNLPRKVYFSGEFPLRDVRFWPIPNISSLDWILWWHDSVDGFPETQAGLDTTMALPPGWAEAMRYNLAIRLAPEFGREQQPTVVALARDSLSWIKTANSEVHATELNVDVALIRSGRRFDYRTGGIR